MEGLSTGHFKKSIHLISPLILAINMGIRNPETEV
jgi:hypothetical protein